MMVLHAHLREPKTKDFREQRSSVLSSKVEARLPGEKQLDPGLEKTGKVNDLDSHRVARLTRVDLGVEKGTKTVQNDRGDQALPEEHGAVRPHDKK